MTDYINKIFARKIGGIREWSWVMEVQNRGSPHIHTVLWTVKPGEGLAHLNDLFVARMPAVDDPL
ncbi:uncharacterized protein BYT42DRAFT_614073 [Radiomyces spectabilis]|uniref:uncharacterized protein n=1 Tax=Radiomyces spectabilis TaxID=64574 RepID=UPI00221FBFAB|nr:uncharacterized protein BYT42DRAFT_614073 [Radiomyces spectabilis]KAI8379810.1 hypothetical protein BYT42DRAFT_614073 [Radiomyces spectabilis]